MDNKMDNKIDTNNKPIKPKQAQYNILTSVLAQFDIQTQVNKIVKREFDSLMRINKQAFDYIKQSEHKLTQFQQRLSKAQTYYKNIESSIDTRVELTQNVNSRLEQFSTEFWTTIKESNDQVTTMMKRLDHVLMEKRQLEGRVGLCEKGIVKNEQQKDQLSRRVTLEVQKLEDMMRENVKKTQQRFIKQNAQIRQISQNIIKSKSLLDSKSALMSQLLRDLQFYKNDRPQIKLQLQTLFSELQNRSLRQDVIELRGYVDSKIVQQRQTMNKLWTRVDTQIKLEERDRKKDVQRILVDVKQVEVRLCDGVKRVQGLLKSEISSLSSVVTKNEQKATQSINQLLYQHSTLKQTYFTQIPPLITKSTQQSIQLLKSLTDLTVKTQDAQKQITQLYSNNQSMNQLIDMIMKQNQQRKEELISLRNVPQSGGNTQEQLSVVFERVYELEKEFGVVKNQSLQRLSNGIRQIDDKYKHADQLIHTKIEQLQQNIQANHSSITQTQNKLTNQLQSSTITLQTKLSTLSQSTKHLINSKLTSIQQRLNLLDAINQQFIHFKQQFRRQLMENEKVNESIGEKMERMMATLIKVKSDWTVRIEQVNVDVQRRAVEIKNTIGQLQEIKTYLSIVNETINLLLATNIFHRTPPLHTTSTNNNNNPTQHNKLQPTSSKPIKITSFLQGWILQSDQLQQKVKYRGENFSVSNRIKFLLSFLQYFVKMTEKIKGSILQNGRDIFMRVIQINRDLMTPRKRPTSKRKVSQLLPKLYL